MFNYLSETIFTVATYSRGTYSIICQKRFLRLRLIRGVLAQLFVRNDFDGCDLFEGDLFIRKGLNRVFTIIELQF